MNIKPAEIINSALRKLVQGKDRRKSALEAIRDFQRIPREGLLNHECNGAYFALISLYRELDHIAERLDAHKVTSEELLVYERVVNHFIGLVKAAGKGEIKLVRLPGADAAEDLPYAHFYAGLFALVRGNSEAAFEHFSESNEFWGVKGKELAELVLNEQVAAAEERLGSRYGRLKAVLDLKASLPTIAPSAPPPVAPPQRPPVQPIDPHLKSAEELSSKGHYLKALAEVLQAGASPIKNQMLRNILDFIRRRIGGEGDHARKLAMINELLRLKPDEKWAYRLAVPLLLQMKQEAEALRFIEKALALEPATADREEYDHFRAVCLANLGKSKEALAIVSGFDDKHTAFKRSLELRLKLCLRLGLADQGKTALQLVKSQGGLPSHKVLEYEAQILLAAARQRAAAGEHAAALAMLDEADEAAVSARRLAKRERDTSVERSVQKLLDSIEAEMTSIRESKIKPLREAEAMVKERQSALTSLGKALVAKQEMIARLRQEIQEKEALIVRLQGELAADNDKLTLLRTELAAAEVKLAEVQKQLERRP